MDERTFVDEVERDFAYLVSDRGFRVAREVFDPVHFGNGLVEFRSQHVGVQVTLDRSQILIDIGPAGQSSDNWFSLPEVQSHFDPTGAEYQYQFPERWDDYDEMIISEIRRAAAALRPLIGPVVTPGFDAWNELERRRTRRVRAKYRALTGKNLPESKPEG
jgi:hypothetical protein